MKTEPNHSIHAGTFDSQLDAQGGVFPEKISAINKGLTKREYFAAMAMIGMLASGRNDTTADYDGLHLESVKHADALIKALNETQP